MNDKDALNKRLIERVADLQQSLQHAEDTYLRWQKILPDGELGVDIRDVIAENTALRPRVEVLEKVIRLLLFRIGEHVCRERFWEDASFDETGLKVAARVAAETVGVPNRTETGQTGRVFLQKP